MTDWFNMGWLLPAHEDFAERLKAPDLSQSAIMDMANRRLNDRQARRLSKTVRARFEADAGLADGFHSVNLAILTDSNLEFMSDMIFATGLKFGLNIKTLLVEYTDIVSQAVNPASELYAFKPNFVLYANFGSLFYTTILNFTENVAASVVDQTLREAKLATQSISSHCDAEILMQTFPAVQPDLFGNLDRFQPGAFSHEMHRLDRELTAMGYPIVDVARLAASVGNYNWFNDGQYHWTKVPFSASYAGLYCDTVIRKIAASQGKAKKCLVLDLDNTLWGGVIGDDGLEGIKLGNNSPAGEAFLAGQRYYKMLANRGVVLAVCSKNDMSNGLLPFEQHPDMILKKEDISCFVANWDPKPGNISYIAKALNLGTDSFVFLDDNPAERNFVRRELPEVCVPEVPDKDSSVYPRMIEAAGYFETGSFTETDLKRVDDYKANAQRAEIMTEAVDLGSYLTALEMKLSYEMFTSVNKDRISQLINRSNQFNLTTRRYTVTEVESFIDSKEKFGFTGRLIDKFSDSGLVVVIICEAIDKATWEIDTWLMSCRVLGRRLEEAMLKKMVDDARAQGVKTLLGRYIPSKKNGMVKAHYEKLGFSLVEEADDGESVWSLDLTCFEDSHSELSDLPFTYVS